jgi:hypothetical protein
MSAGSPIIRETATDLSASIGKLITFSAGVPSLSASATVPAQGIILDARKRVVGANTTYDNSLLLLGGGEVVLAKISASATAISAGDALQQSTDGTLTNDAGSGARTIVAFAVKAAVAGDLAVVRLSPPVSRGTIAS